MNVLEKRIMFRTLCIVIACTFLLVTELAFAMKVKLLTLEQMIETAEVVFIGVCISALIIVFLSGCGDPPVPIDERKINLLGLRL